MAAEGIAWCNTASRWNKALLDNSARPSGALVYTARDGNLTLEQYDRLKAELEQAFQGAARCCWKAGSTGSRCRCRPRTWTSSRPSVGYGPITNGDELKGSDPAGLTPSDSPDPKANFNPGQLRDETGRWAGDGLVHDASRRRGGRSQGTPAQEAQHALAATRAQAAVRRVRELDPTWQPPRSVSSTIEGAIRHHEMTARVAEARLAHILRDAIPNTNPLWGVNRLRSELSEQGYIFSQPARRGRGYILENPQTGEQVRIMERPERQYRSDPAEKHIFGYYYRYRPGFGRPEGAHTPMPDR